MGLSDAALCGVTLHTVCVAIGNCTERERERSITVNHYCNCLPLFFNEIVILFKITG